MNTIDVLAVRIYELIQTNAQLEQMLNLAKEEIANLKAEIEADNNTE